MSAVTKVRILIAAALALAAFGCSSDPVQPQEWWDERPDLARARVVECNSMAELQRSADTNCARALAAAVRGSNSGTEVLPPAEPWFTREPSVPSREQDDE